MIINNDSLANVLGTIRMHYKDGLAERVKPLPMWAQEIPSTTKMEEFPITMLLATMREWIGGRIINGIDVKLLQMINRDFELSWGIPTNDMEDDKIGYIGPVFSQAGKNAANHPHKVAVDSLTANGDWLDGDAFFYATRAVGKSGTILNTIATALTEDSFNAAVLTMQSYLLPNGEPAEVNPMKLVVGPKNRVVAHEIVNQGPGATAANANAGAAVIEVNPRLVGDFDDYWFLMDEERFGPPVLITNRKTGPIIALDKPTDRTGFLGTASGTDGNVPGGVNVYGIHHRRVATPALPWAIYRGGTGA